MSDSPDQVTTNDPDPNEMSVPDREPIAFPAPRTTPRKFIFKTYDQILHQHRQQFLIDGVLVQNSLAALIGHPGAYKSFVALEIARCVSTGQPFFGRPVAQLPVAFVAAEGSAGLSDRIAAFRNQNQPRNDDLRFLGQAVELLDPVDVEHLLVALDDFPKPPGLIVMDTLARCMTLGEENSATDMSRMIAAAAKIQRSTGACILLVHHLTKSGDEIRGSSALRGALDTIIRTKPSGRTVTVYCDKQKDHAEFEPITLLTTEIDLGGGRSSLVLNLGQSTPAATPVMKKPTTRSRMLADLTSFGPTGALVSVWLQAGGNDVKRRTFFDIKKQLIADGLVHQQTIDGREWCFVAKSYYASADSSDNT